MILGRKATLRPSPEQSRAFGRACGAARKAWNWGLARKQEAWLLRKAAIESGVALKDAPKVPNAIELHRELNIKKKLPVEESGFPWMYESSKCAPQEALRNLDAAFENFFRRIKAGETPGYPRFKARGRNPGHFTVMGSLQVKGGRIRIPRVGAVRFMPGDRGYLPDGTYTSATIREDGGHWCVSVHLEIAEAAVDNTRPVVGLDAGVRELAHLSDGTVIENPQALAREAGRLHRANLAIARKQRAADKRLGKRKKGERREESKRLKRARRVVARLSRRVANIRRDGLQKATTWLARTYSVVVVEKLDGAEMTRRRAGRGRARKAALNRAILDSGMLRLRSMLAYKMPLHGGELRVVAAAYTSQTCSRCGAGNAVGASKIYECAECGVVLDRDDNASQNILSAASCPAEPVRESVAASRGAVVRPKAKAPRHAALSRPSEGDHA